MNRKGSLEEISILYTTFIVWPDKNTRFDWLISGPTKDVLDRPKGGLDREIEGLLQYRTKWTANLLCKLLFSE